MPTEDTKVKVVQRLAKIGAELSALEEDEFPSEELTQRLQYLRELRADLTSMLLADHLQDS